MGYTEIIDSVILSHISSTLQYHHRVCCLELVSRFGCFKEAPTANTHSFWRVSNLKKTHPIGCGSHKMDPCVCWLPFKNHKPRGTSQKTSRPLRFWGAAPSLRSAPQLPIDPLRGKLPQAPPRFAREVGWGGVSGEKTCCKKRTAT